MSKPDPSFTAQMDQAGAYMGSVAGLLGQFFRELLSNGFERAEAMELIHHYFEELNGGDEEDE